MYDQRFTGVADADPLGLGIEYDVQSHLEIRSLIHEDMAVPGSRLDDRHRTVLHHGTDQSGSAARNQHIHVIVQAHEFLRHLPVGIGDKLYTVLRESRFLKSCTEAFDDGLIGL